MSNESELQLIEEKYELKGEIAQLKYELDILKIKIKYNLLSKDITCT